MIEILLDPCSGCLNVGKWGWATGWASAYGVVVLLFAFAKTGTFTSEAIKSENALASLWSANPSALPIIGMIVQKMAIILTPRNYILLLASLYQLLRRLTGIDRRSMLGNIFIFLIFYYVVVSGPAAVMRPKNFLDVPYTALSLFALGMMMLTNAIGDIISLRITFRNVGKLKILYEEKNSDSSIKTSYWTEARLYFTTMIDALMALCVLFVILLLTSVFFGWSVRTHGITPSTCLLEGSLCRIQSFWSTVHQPYIFVPELVPGFLLEFMPDNISLPMLLIFSLTTFLPTAALLIFSIIWTLLMPLRIIFHTNLHRVTKIFFSEIVVFSLCTVVLSLISFIGSDLLLFFKNDYCFSKTKCATCDVPGPP